MPDFMSALAFALDIIEDRPQLHRRDAPLAIDRPRWTRHPAVVPSPPRAARLFEQGVEGLLRRGHAASPATTTARPSSTSGPRSAPRDLALAQGEASESVLAKSGFLPRRIAAWRTLPEAMRAT
jgi:hypothetical protein